MSEIDKIKNEIFDHIFKHASKCMHCRKESCGHNNRTLHKMIDRDVVWRAIENVEERMLKEQSDPA